MMASRDAGRGEGDSRQTMRKVAKAKVGMLCDLIRSLPSKATVVRMACVDSSPSLHQVVSSMNGKRHGADHDDPKRRYAGLAGGYVRSSVQFSYNQHR